MKMTGFIRNNAKRVAAILMIAALYHFARLPELSETERTNLASRFRFARMALPELPNTPGRTVRKVHPSMAGISAWISAVGASAALNGLDRDGLPNDICYVDPRNDQVIIAPVPGTPERYKPFALDYSKVSYDAATMAPMGCLPGDMNEDGLVDILVYYAGRTPLAFLQRNDNSSGPVHLTAESFVAREIVSNQECWNTSTATLADLSGRGHLDLIVGNYFEDGAKILDASADGVEQMQDSMSRAFNGGRNRLLRWEGATKGLNPTVSFKEIDGAFSDEVALGWTLAIATGDLDGDLLPEIYFANDFGPDRLLHNLSTPGEYRFSLLEGEKTFTTPSSKVLGRDSFKGMGVDFGDLNGDGLLDIYVSNITDEFALQESHFAFLSTGDLKRMKMGIAPYVDASEPLGLSRSGWAWDCRLGDFDNDGVLEAIQATGFVKGKTNRWPEFQELAMGNDNLLHDPRFWPRFQPGDDISGQGHIPFFVRASDNRYYDIARYIGLDNPQVSRAIATADVDGDGQLDFVVANQWGASYFYHNESPDPGAFLGLHLLLPLSPDENSVSSVRPGHPGTDTPGRYAIGAFATVKLTDGRNLVASVDGGNGHAGKRSPDLLFGLGRAAPDNLYQINLRWRDPDGRIHSETWELSPGWYTVLLNWPKGSK